MVKKKIVFIERDEAHFERIQNAFNGIEDEFEVSIFPNLAAYHQRAFRGTVIDLIFSGIPDIEITNWLRQLKVKSHPPIPVVFISEQGSEELAVSLVKKGAMDFFTLNENFFSELPSIVRRILREWENVQARQSAETELRKVESKYRKVAEMVNDVIWELDINFKHYQFIGDSITGFLGYTPEEFLKMEFVQTIHPDSIQHIEKKRKQFLIKLREGADPLSMLVNMEICFIHKDGSTRWGEARGFVVTNDKNQIVAISGVTRNITEQKNAEKQLSIKDAFFATLIREAPMAIVVLDKQDVIQEVNNHFLELFEYKAEDCIGLPVNDIIVPDNKKEEGNSLTQVAAVGDHINVETVRQTKSGKLIDVHIMGQPVVLNDSLLGVFGIYQDISKRKEYEKRLKKLSERLLLATRAANVGIWDYSLESKELLWEEEMYELHGVEKVEGVDLMKIWEAVVVENDKALFNFIFTEKIFIKENFDKTYRINGPDGKIRHIKLFASVHFDSMQQPARVVGCCWDITNEIENAELNKKIEISSKVANIKQQFLANMSHEIRSPMTGILGMLDLLMRSPLDDQQLFYAETIKKSSDGLLHIVNDILDLSKIEAGKMIIKPRLYNVRSSAQTIFSLFRALAQQKNIDLQLEIDPNLPSHIYADENRVSQVVTNLLSNAIKFTEKGWVKVSYEKIREDEESLVIRISVADSGIGISDEDVEKLFKMFSQLDSSDTRNYDGAGLGLSISERLAELMNARIDVHSHLGEGSTFSFTMSCPKIKHTSPKPEEQEADEQMPEKLPYRVLLVEDKVTNQMVISLMLKEIGCTVDVASNGQEALDTIAPGKYDFVFMDVQMPVMDGLTAVKKLRMKFRESELPYIIGLSAKAMEGDPEYHITRGMNDYLTKPVTTDILKKCLNRWSKKISSN